MWTTLGRELGGPSMGGLCSHCNVESFVLPWHSVLWVSWPWCGDKSTQDHVLWEGGIIRGERELACRVDPYEYGCLGWLASCYDSHIGHFVWAAAKLIKSEDVASVHKQQWISHLACPDLCAQAHTCYPFDRYNGQKS